MAVIGKPHYECELIEFACITPTNWLAFVKVLDAPAERFRRTSLIVRIDFEHREIETMNSVYKWR